MVYTKKSYTSKSMPAKVQAENADGKIARVEWEPGTRESISKFPDGPRSTLGYYLWLIEKGEIPPTSTPFPGVKGAFELRAQDGSSWYRVVHLKATEGKVYVLHCFEKQSNQVEKRDIRTIEDRLANLNRRLLEGKRDAKRKKIT
jgi:phage-related protein